MCAYIYKYVAMASSLLGSKGCLCVWRGGRALTQLLLLSVMNRLLPRRMSPGPFLKAITI